MGVFTFLKNLFLGRTDPLLTSPWRKFDGDIWNDKAHDEMIKNMKTYFKMTESFNSANILLIGPVGSGKSSFVNSILSIGGNSVLDPAHSGRSTTSYTTQLRVHEGRFANFGPMKLYDIRGLEEDKGITEDDIKLLLKGHISKNYNFVPEETITEADKKYVKCPKTSDKINLVVFCCDASVLMRKDGVPTKLLQKIKRIRKEVKQLGLNRMLLLTHVDEICTEVSRDIKTIFHSEAVKRAVGTASELFEIPESFIHPVENYHQDSQTHKMRNVHLMLALQHMLEVASDYVYRYVGEFEEHENASEQVSE